MSTVATPPQQQPTVPTAPVDPDDGRQPAWRRVGKRLFGYAVLLAFAAIFIFPFMLAIISSFKTRADAAQTPLNLIPDPFTVQVFTQELADARFPRWVFVSIVVTVAVTVGRLILNSLAGYALSRLDFPGRRVVFVLIVATLAIPAIVLAIPRFLVMGTLGMLNSWSGLILPLAVDAFGIFLMKQFFDSVPREMEEAARVDGATIFQTFSRIILPLATPALIALTILSFQGSWNEFLHPLIAAPSAPELRTLPVGLALLKGSFGESLNFPVLMGASVLTTIPVAIIFFAFQRYFTQGVATSGIKG